MNPNSTALVDVAYLPRSLVLATLPHSKPDTDTFTRINGAYRLSLLADPAFGLPYGSWSRLLLSWMCTTAVQQGHPHIDLERSQAAFMATFGISSTGGARGTTGMFKEHLMRLCTATVRASFMAPERLEAGGFCLTDEVKLWHVEEGQRCAGKVLLSARMMQQLRDHAVPLDLQALMGLRRAPMALDIYAWLTYRFFSLQKPTLISWPSLKRQFGADYKELYSFRYHFRKHLERVKGVYPTARLRDKGLRGLLLLPSPPHVSARLASG